jgi:protein SCO1/2
MAGSDYTATSGSLTFADSVTSQSFSVPIIDDSNYEADESFTVSLSNATGGAALGVPATATVTIGDNDAPPPAGTLQFDSSAYSATEGSSVRITVTRSGGSTGDVSVDYQIEAGSATSGSDFEPMSGSIAFADGETSRSFDIPLPDDTLVEGNETFTAQLTAASGGADIGSPAMATVTIIDNDSDTGTGGGSGGGGGGGGAVSPVVMLLLACLAFFAPPQVFAGESPGSDPHAHHKKMMSESTYRRSLHDYDLGDIGVTRADSVETTLADLVSRDKPVMVHFIFTTCTTICPVQAATFAQVQRQLGDEAADVQMVSVSIDPEYDTPERLAEYAKKFRAGPQWDFITGTSEQMIAVQKAFDAYEGNKMNHRALTLMRMPGSDEWIRLEGLISASVIVDEYRKFKNES